MFIRSFSLLFSQQRCYFFRGHQSAEMVSHGHSNTNIPNVIVPDGGWGWIVVFASFMIHLIMDGWVELSHESFTHPESI